MVQKHYKIAILTDFLAFQGGIEKSILLLTQELTRRGHEVTIYTGLYDAKSTFKEFSPFIIKPFLTKKLPEGIHGFYLRNKFRRLKLHGYDGTIIFGFHTIAAGKHNHPNVWWSTRPLPYLYGLWGTGPDKATLNKASFFKRVAMKTYFAHLLKQDKQDIQSIDTLYSVGVLAQKAVENAYTPRKAPVLVQPINLDHYRTTSKQGTYYLNIARHVSDKNVGRIIQAFKGMPDKKLIQVGAGEQRAEMHALAAGAKNITFKGFVEEEELPKLVAGSIAMISASENEDYSMNLIESIASGKPTISTNIDRTIKAIVQTPTGLLLPNSQPATLQRAIRQLTPEKALKMQKACLTRSKSFSAEQFADTLLEALNL